MKLNFSGYFNIKTVFLILFASLNPGLAIYAGDNDGLASTIKLEAKVSNNLNHNLLDRYWDPGYGAELLAEFPFYTGVVQAGFSIRDYKGLKNEYPSFTGTFLYICMGGEIKLPLKFELFGGIKAGYFLMTFDDDTLTSYQKFESELMAGANFRLSYPVTDNIYLSVSSDIAVLMTHDRLKFYTISAGAAYKFNSPKWIRDIFN
jgi:hypothetical protein